MPLNIFNIRSSSKGNCTYIGNHKEAILLDCGISPTLIFSTLNEVGLNTNIIAVLITHEHSDHISGLNTFKNRCDAPIYGTKETLKNIKFFKHLDVHQTPFLRPLNPHESFYIGDFEIYPFSVSHDAANPVAYRIYHAGFSASFLTDVGHFSKKNINFLEGSDFVFLESNYDPTLLQNSSYRAFLKTRIKGKRGHLDNDSASKIAVELHSKGTQHFLLAHVSQNSNTYELAYNTTLQAFEQNHLVLNQDFTLHMARHDEHSKIYRFE